MPTTKNGKTVTVFFQRLLDLCAVGLAMMVRNQAGPGYVCFVNSGRYYGTWHLGAKTVWSRLDASEYAGAAAAHTVSGMSWKKGMARAKDRNRSDLVAVRWFLNQYRLSVEGLDAAETMIKAYDGEAGLELWREMGNERRLRLGYWFTSSLFASLGIRRQAVLRRFLRLSEKKAWRKTFTKLHPAIVNQVREQIMDPMSHVGGGIPNRYMIQKLFPKFGQHHRVHKVSSIWAQMPNTLPGTNQYKPGLYACDDTTPWVHEIMDWYARHPGAADTLEVFLAEFRNLKTRPYWHQLVELDAIDAEIDYHWPEWETVTPGELRRIHDQVFPDLVERKRQIQDTARAKMRLRQASAGREVDKRRELLSSIIEDADSQRREAKLMWTTNLDSLPDIEGMTLLRTQTDYFEEGEAMHHCVSGYHCRLGLSAYDLVSKEFITPEAAWVSDEQTARALAAQLRWDRSWLYCWHVESKEDKGTLAVWFKEEEGRLVAFQFDQFRGVCNRKVSNKLVALAIKSFDNAGLDGKLIRP